MTSKSGNELNAAPSRPGLLDTSGPTQMVWVKSETGHYPAYLYVREDGTVYVSEEAPYGK